MAWYVFQITVTSIPSLLLWYDLYRSAYAIMPGDLIGISPDFSLTPGSSFVLPANVPTEFDRPHGYSTTMPVWAISIDGSNVDVRVRVDRWNMRELNNYFGMYGGSYGR